ncbi:MAG: hypothetical protein ONB48_01260 [candidate division KSB1 bacterium]|nr:hypothetical protein [candidate division KSB1 bacterium]MDZ7272694.1 hypothetical protein [candidate division KSB1 bacterium]MDZ7284283.1 hypothetical protein [candidate division KSB1 bacterium]MDZ7297321.1 hypothetical protein [candidate division KSB1 bacterium]MDZ7308389.1 hypothetical protein [candidate division KSB1 bacterium]
MKVKHILWCLVLVGTGFAQTQDYALGVRAQAMGGSGVALAREAEGQLQNPALLAELPGWSTTVFYSRPFGLPELSLSSLAFAGRLGGLGVGSSAVAFGHDLLREQTLLLAVARRFPFPGRPAAGGIALGLQFGVQQKRIVNYGQSQSVVVNAGVLARLHDKLVWGMAAGNLMRTRAGRGQERLPRHLACGLAYVAGRALTLQFDLYKQPPFPLEWRLGLELALLPPLWLRLGGSENPDRFTCGLALTTRSAMVQVTTFSHVDLGWTQQAALTLRR